MPTQNIFDLVDVWNAGATTFTAIKMNVTDTASTASSLLMDLQLGPASRFRVNKEGSVFTQNPADTGGLYSAGANGFRTIQFGGTTFNSNGVFAVRDNSQVVVRGQGGFSWENGGNNPAGGTIDLTLARDAGNTLAQRNGTNAQTSRLYGTYTDASNYRRLTKTMSTAGVAEIKPEGAGTGASGNVLHISGLPTSNPGPGILWNNAGTPAIGT